MVLTAIDRGIYGPVPSPVALPSITTRRGPLRPGTAVLACAFAASIASGASADQTFHVTGKDTFTIGSADMHTEISYTGQESLHERHAAGSTTYRVQARYRRVDQGASSQVTATFAAAISNTGDQRDLEDSDPDYLTLLNQPFAVQLDAATLRDLSRLHADVPFDFPSPMTGSTLRGKLRRIGEGIVSGARALGVSFDAGGPMRGALPDRRDMRLIGRIRMRGSAYYRSEDALLILLDATLTISGNLTKPGSSDPVTIVYRRTIRANPPEPARKRGS